MVNQDPGEALPSIYMVKTVEEGFEAHGENMKNYLKAVDFLVIEGEGFRETLDSLRQVVLRNITNVVWIILTKVLSV